MSARRLPDQITFGDKYGPAMSITTQAEADAYFELLVEHTMRMRRCDRAEAVKIEKCNLGYWAGYGYDRERVERLFRCQHPVFGSVIEQGHPTPERAFVLGLQAGRKAM